MFATKALAVGALTAAAVAAMAAPALAEGNGSKAGAYEQLRIEKTADSSAAWTSVTDSPLDTNKRALVINIPTTNSDYVAVYSRHSVNLNLPVSSVKNLSYEFDNRASFGGGAPRISVVLSDGSVAYLSPEGCAQPEAAGYNNWSRSDFTGATSNCSFTVSGAAAGTYVADGTQSAWQVFATANPSLSVSETFLAVDGNSGRYVVDRIALGTNHLYNYNNIQAVNCSNTESRC